MKESEIIEMLRKESEEFRKLEDEHRGLDEKIIEMDKNRFLTSEEEIEKKRLQKEKLVKKDRIAELIREYKKVHSN